MRPRPILKPLPSPTITTSCPLPFSSSAHVPPLDSPHVHFPPTPTMTQTEVTHSAFTYDRKPIVVAPNICALPERGGRKLDVQTWSDMDRVITATSCRSERMIKGGYFHPRACEAYEYETPSNSSSLQFEHDASIQSAPSQPYPYPYPNHLRSSLGLQNSSRTHHERDQDRLSKHVPPPLVFDSSTESESSDMGSPPMSLALNEMPTHPYHYGRKVPMDLSLPFMTTKEGLSLRPSLKRRNGPNGERIPTIKEGKQRTRTSSLDRTRKAVSAGATTICGSFNAGFCEPGLEGCLGGF